ncbi:CPBP family intramembrane metalloprotease [Lysobacter sp. S4-A87]|uniref:CPBP family intramembrane glutamic endopeptidase n=1 Tax=Lysobacter sp. S4-A87 TaxID=2925843 RepID=UPI001F53D925|nr:CPBP family intramembrane glutamic endopeptidase [Lysobacter sp. S4-A87]UNK48355.1 CPBP family intramembrane metalloprotease [Lysobacter sp. S4-A87]
MFVAAVLAISWGFDAFLIGNGGVRHFGPMWLVALMWIPGAVSIALRVVLRSGFDDIGLTSGNPGAWLQAVAIPLAVALLVGLTATSLDIRHFALVTPQQWSQLSPLLLPLLAMGLVGALGEELGWRGFLLPKLIAGGVRHPYLVCGLVWALWHFPLIAFGGFYQVDNALLMAAIYCVGIVAMSFVLSELRMRSGSVLVPTLAHASHNFLLQFAVPALALTVPGSRAGLWDTVAGDTGASIALFYAIFFVIQFSTHKRICAWQQIRR